MKKFLILLALPLLFASCEAGISEKDVCPTTSTEKFLTAGFDEEVRTYVENGLYLRWHADDRISAFYGNTLNQEYRFLGNTGDNSGRFEPATDSDLGTGNALNQIYAVYPHNPNNTVSDWGVVSLNLPSEQEYAHNSFGAGANTMIAVTKNLEDTFLAFKNACGYLKIRLYGNATISKITLTGNNNEPIAGEATINHTYGGEPLVVMGSNATSEITLNCGTGVTLGSTADSATDFWFVVPETPFENGITIKAVGTDGGIFEQTTSKSIAITRNTIQPMEAVEFQATNYATQTNVKEVRTLLLAMNPTSTAMEVTEQIAAMTLTGVVVGEPNGNMGNNKSIVIQDDSNVAGAGLTIYCTSNVSDDLAIGNVVSVSLSGAKVQLYGALLQVANIAPEAIVVSGSTTVEPIDVSLSNILDYESQYVKLSNVYPASGVAGNVWNSATNAKNVNFMTADGEAFVIRVSGYASFKSEVIPEKMGSICGVASQYNGTIQLMPQYASDIQLTEDIPTVDIMPVTIADILKVGAGTYKVENAWAVATYDRGCLLTDNSGAYILAYNPDTTPAVGDVITISGSVTTYAGLKQFAAGATVTVTGTTTVTHPTAEVMDGAALDAYLSAPVVKYVEYEGVLASGSYHNVTVDGAATAIGSVQYPTADLKAQLTELNGKKIKVTGYLIGVSSSKYTNTMAIAVEESEAPETPETPDTPVVNNGIYGTWHIKSYCGAPSDIDIYMQLNEDGSFLLYQRSNSATYVEYSGTYTLDEANAIISGVYSDGSSWANSYNYSINSNNELVFVNTNNSAEITIYEPATMPSISTLNISRAANISNIKPL